MNDINWSRPVVGLDARLWGRYRRNVNRQPLCSVSDCYRYATHRFISNALRIGCYCERHTGEFAAWHQLLSDELEDE